MKLIVTNTSTKMVIGGMDNLLPVNLFDELYDYMSVKVPGAHFSKAKSKYKWDGMKHLLTKKGKFATGFLPMIVKYADELGAKIEIVDARKNVPKFVPLEQRVWSHNISWEMRDYQEEVVNKFENYIEYNGGKRFYFPRGIADAATNAGKNSILSGVFRNVENVSGLLLINSSEIFEQLYTILSVDFRVGRINSKSKGVPERFEWGEDITIAMVKTLKNKMDKSINVQKELATRFNVVAVDECHEASAPIFSDILMHTDAGMVVFVSGTALMKADLLSNMVIVGLSGAVIKKITKKFLMDNGYSLPVKVFVHLNPTYTTGFESYEQQLEHGIFKSNTRCDIIAKIIEERPGKKILINFRVIEHGQYMYDYLKEIYGIEQMELVHGQDKSRREKISRFRSGETMILIASDILKQGFSLDDINVLIHARDGKAKIASSQWSGRIERDDGVSDFVELHEFFDEAKYLAKHSRVRIGFLEKEGFEINYMYEHNKWGSPL